MQVCLFVAFEVSIADLDRARILHRHCLPRWAKSLVVDELDVF